MFGRAVNVLSGFFVAVSLLMLVASFAVPFPAGAAEASSSSAAGVVVAVDAGAGGAAVESSGLLQAVLSALPDWLQALSLLVAAFASIAALTPTPKDDGIMLVLRRVVDFLALNFGGAKNASTVKDSRVIR
jgi:hypothetical protein